MKEERSPKASDESTAGTSVARQRKKRKWDQPAEALISAGLEPAGALISARVALPGALQPGTGGINGIFLPGSVPLSGGHLTNPVPATFATTSQINVSAIVQKISQPKVQDELIAREIVINDAEPTVRYKLTKRQTQEEIQKSTGSVIITRGKYHPPNGLPDSEKPLYLHISAGSHLKDTAERIKAVDHAALMVEEILKQGQISLTASIPFHSVTNNGQAMQSLSTTVYLGFDTETSLNIAARIRGPNDQYINHIMNETGATAVLRGRGSVNSDSPQDDEIQQPLHLYLSSTNRRSLEDARILAENLMDTICAECGATRISSCKVYGAVPPPHQLLVGVQTTSCTVAGSTSVSSNSSSGAVVQPGGLTSYMTPQPNLVRYPSPSVSGGTCYSGYGGIYPQATPLQQVALALRQAPTLTTSAFASIVPATTMLPKTGTTSTIEADKKAPQKRKFQELPVASKGPKTLTQNLRWEEFVDPISRINSSTMPPPKKLVPPERIGMPPPPPPPPPPPKNMPPPPPKFLASQSPPEAEHIKLSANKPSPEPASDTLLKLVEYGEEEDDMEAPDGDISESNPMWNTASKPFWAV